MHTHIVVQKGVNKILDTGKKYNMVVFPILKWVGNTCQMVLFFFFLKLSILFRVLGRLLLVSA